jgi:myo-inositol-1(or 4)-monophosphatase
MEYLKGREAQIQAGVEALARQCGDLMLRRSGDLQTGEIHFKDRRNLVTEVDLACEALLVEGLRDLLPEANFQTEEGLVPGTDRGLRWVVDPLDGTTNFVHRLPIVSVSIALVDDQQVDLGVVYAPFQDEMFAAIRGSGAFCNGQRLNVSRPAGLEDALLATGFPFQRFDRIQAYMDVLQTLMRQCRGLRRMGSAAIDLAYVAAGRFDGYFEYNLQPWDVAAGLLLVQEAGGQVGSMRPMHHPLDGREVLAAPAELYPALEALLRMADSTHGV